MTARLAYSVATAVEATGLSRSTIERAIRCGQLKAKKSSLTDDGEPTGKYVIRAADLETYLDDLADA